MFIGLILLVPTPRHQICLPGKWRLAGACLWTTIIFVLLAVDGASISMLMLREPH